MSAKLQGHADVVSLDTTVCRASLGHARDALHESLVNVPRPPDR